MYKEDILLVNFIIDGKKCVIPTKVMWDQLDDDEIIAYYAVSFGNKDYRSAETTPTEHAIINFQRILPQNVKIACCQSCRHGNFCPYGDYDNEVFCLKGLIPKDKMDVCDIFGDLNNADYLSSRSRKLLDYCTDYKPVDKEFYSYNDWGYFIKW